MSQSLQDGQLKLTPELIQRYNVDGPRYTSYPTAPQWHDGVTGIEYKEGLFSVGREDRDLSLYIHIPFCDKRCLFCACNVVIRKQKDAIGDRYLDALEKEILMVLDNLGCRSRLKQVHLGGGTPTYLSDTQLQRLVSMLKTHFDLTSCEEMSIELDPRTMNPDRLTVLHELGFNRLSFGVQDMTKKVQKAINREHSFESIDCLFKRARELGIKGINVDLIYGLPHQTPERFQETLQAIQSLKPDRMALYSYAHVPWLQEHQKALEKQTLPEPEEKIALFLQAQHFLLAQGYIAIAMDHYALAEDEMAQAFYNGGLCRNFMGYSTLPTTDYIGLGVSAIGYIDGRYIQNTRALEEYYQSIEEGALPTHRGLHLSQEDLARKWVIEQLMCQFSVDKNVFKQGFNVDFDTFFEQEQGHLASCEQEGLLDRSETTIQLTPLGKLFVRNVCMGFDAYFQSKSPTQRFSKTV